MESSILSNIHLSYPICDSNNELDETMIEVFGQNDKKNIWRSQDEAFQHNTIPTVKHSGARGTGALHKVDDHYSVGRVVVLQFKSCVFHSIFLVTHVDVPLGKEVNLKCPTNLLMEV
ncbi:hypothetical protein AMECASPLE_027982 [Ameca splendens]|uniref:Uncharacterized protein n=1 Tax=Ameca splendens TaxID=208324 RepID=A0ABV1A0V8_9TELE